MKYYFNKEACIREWEEYFINPLNGVKKHADKLLQDMKRIQNSESEKEFENLMFEIRSTTVWNQMLQLEFRKKWFSLSKVDFYSTFICYFKIVP